MSYFVLSIGTALRGARWMKETFLFSHPNPNSLLPQQESERASPGKTMIKARREQAKLRQIAGQLRNSAEDRSCNVIACSWSWHLVNTSLPIWVEAGGRNHLHTHVPEQPQRCATAGAAFTELR